MDSARRGNSGLLVLLWAVVLAEVLSPVPLLLSLGAAYVLLFRPGWFPRLVAELYGDRF